MTDHSCLLNSSHILTSHLTCMLQPFMHSREMFLSFLWNCARERYSCNPVRITRVRLYPSHVMIEPSCQQTWTVRLLCAVLLGFWVYKEQGQVVVVLIVYCRYRVLGCQDAKALVSCGDAMLLRSVGWGWWLNRGVAGVQQGSGAGLGEGPWHALHHRCISSDNMTSASDPLECVKTIRQQCDIRPWKQKNHLCP